MQVPLTPYSIDHPDPGLHGEIIEILDPKVQTTIDTPLISTQIQQALIDSGSYATYFYTSTKLNHTPLNLRPAGKDNKNKGLNKNIGLIPATHTKAKITIQSDGTQYSWPANILLTNEEVAPVLGYIGFFEFFEVSFDSINKIVEFEPNDNFPGKATDFWQ